MSPLPPPATLSADAIRTALDLYPSLVERVYRSKLKDPAKVAEALVRDKWRFEELPAAIAGMKSGEKSEAKRSSSHADIFDGALTKDAVERLVQWKITHGHSRPFLPAMVRKNDPITVQTQTKLAWRRLSESPKGTASSLSTASSALDVVCKLKGIGPATGTLILNVYDPDHVPFFQDEMFSWFFPNTTSDKLKYTQKEYMQLLEAAEKVLRKLGIKAVELEKISYVLGHLQLLEPAPRKQLENALRSNEEEIKDEDGKHAVGSNEEKTSTIHPEKGPSTKKRARRASPKLDVDDSNETNPPKRRSQRTK